MKISQYYSIINGAMKQVFGQDAIDVVNVATLSDAGKFIASHERGKELFGNAVCDVLAKTYFDVETFKEVGIPFLSQNTEYGAFFREVYVEMPEARANSSWKVGEVGFTPNPFAVSKVPVSVKIYDKVVNTHEFPYTIPDKLFDSAFNSEADVVSYIDAIATAVTEAYKLYAIEIARLVRCKFIARKALAENSVTAINILSKYKEINPSTTLDEDTCWYDKDFNVFMAEVISRYPKRLAKPSSLYVDEETENGNQYVRETDADNLVFELIGDVAQKMKYFMSSEVYHQELASMPNYNEVDYWQGAGETDDMADHMAIAVDLGTADSPEEVELTGVVGLMYDKRAMTMTYNDPHTVSQRNNIEEYTNYVLKANYAYADKLCHNAVVFYVADDDWSFHDGGEITLSTEPQSTVLYQSTEETVADINSNIYGQPANYIVEWPESGYDYGVFGGVPYTTLSGYGDGNDGTTAPFIALRVSGLPDGGYVQIDGEDVYNSYESVGGDENSATYVIELNPETASNSEITVTAYKSNDAVFDVKTLQIAAFVHSTDNGGMNPGVAELVNSDLGNAVGDVFPQLDGLSTSDLYDSIAIEDGELNVTLKHDYEDAVSDTTAYVTIWPATDSGYAYRTYKVFYTVDGTEWTELDSDTEVCEGLLEDSERSLEENVLVFALPLEVAVTVDKVRFVSADDCYKLDLSTTIKIAEDAVEA